MTDRILHIAVYCVIFSSTIMQRFLSDNCMDYGKYMLNIVWLSLQDATQAVSHRISCNFLLETSYALCLFHIGSRAYSINAEIGGPGLCRRFLYILFPMKW
jgi:hypothetical protein